ncbi:MAG TPA: hypothetical protein VEG37_09300 [Burkholderiales bacterium]|nr:hypothetical protein [Burkholderiales bacterium]
MKTISVPLIGSGTQVPTDSTACAAVIEVAEAAKDSFLGVMPPSKNGSIAPTTCGFSGAIVDPLQSVT